MQFTDVVRQDNSHIYSSAFFFLPQNNPSDLSSELRNVTYFCPDLRPISTSTGLQSSRSSRIKPNLRIQIERVNVLLKLESNEALVLKEIFRFSTTDDSSLLRRTRNGNVLENGAQLSGQQYVLGGIPPTCLFSFWHLDDNYISGQQYNILLLFYGYVMIRDM
ncbi:unnamed protein product [Rhizophagus irregularis]|nr:unnamed protein product [Rhizophagus irregularis]